MNVLFPEIVFSQWKGMCVVSLLISSEFMTYFR